MATLATLLFTDIVGSTERAAELHDARWEELRRRHHTIVRRELHRFGGREVNTAGDGFLVAFDDPARAIRCACVIRDGVRELGLEVRSGLHIGQVVGAGCELGGLAVHIGARVAAQARAGEVLISSTLRDTLAGSEFEFEDCGTRPLKRVPGEWRLFAVSATPEVPGELPDKWRHQHRRVAFVGTAVACALLAGAAILWLSGDSESGGASDPVKRTGTALGSSTLDRRSIAVLPFVNMSGDAENEYFSDGMTEEVINALAKVRGLLCCPPATTTRWTSRWRSFYARSLHGIPERGDRLIAATALELGYPLMTRDPGICRMAAVDRLW